MESMPGTAQFKQIWKNGGDLEFRISLLPEKSLTRIERQQKSALLGRVFGVVSEGIEWSPMDWSVLIKVNGNVVTNVDIVTRMGSLAEKPVYFGGIGGVATHPEYRNQGLANLALNNAAWFLRYVLDVDFGLLICSKEMIPYYARLGWQAVANPVYYDQPGGKVRHDGETMILSCRRSEWVDGIVDLAGYPW